MALYQQINRALVYIPVGGMADIMDRLDEMSAAISQKASEESYGMCKISRSSSVTTNDGLVLGADEKNSAVSGSIMNEVDKLSSKIKPELYIFSQSEIKNGTMQWGTFCRKYPFGLTFLSLGLSGVRNRETILTLPKGFRPDFDISFPCAGNDGTDGWLAITHNGDVFPYRAADANGWCFATVSFYAQ